MMMFVPDAVEDEKFCRACGDGMRQHPPSRMPLNLPCSHEVCKGCVQTLEKGDETTCPICLADHHGEYTVNYALAAFYQECYVAARYRDAEISGVPLPDDVRLAVDKRENCLPADKICNSHPDEETTLWCSAEKKRMCRLCETTNPVKPIEECGEEIAAAKAEFFAKLEQKRKEEAEQEERDRKLAAYSQKMREETLAKIDELYEVYTKELERYNEEKARMEAEVDAQIAALKAAPDYNPRIIPVKHVEDDTAQLKAFYDSFANCLVEVKLSFDADGNIVETVVEKPASEVSTEDVVMEPAMGGAGSGEVIAA